ncbi:MAG: rRNA maturation RNase YbeY [Actinobacteria bacterium]|nr:MAG: rRNA maturation RNase YbeY [Actinomycetota bacterium]
MIDVVNESGDAVDEAGVAEQARFVLDRLRIHPAADLSILFADVEAMTDLHVMWMDEPGPTDVMSFPMDELRVPRDDEEPTEGLLGDVVICPAVARDQARKAGHSERDEVGLLLTHGILHLLGYDHAEPDEERLMFGLQTRLVGEWASLTAAAEAAEAAGAAGEDARP